MRGQKKKIKIEYNGYALTHRREVFVFAIKKSIKEKTKIALSAMLKADFENF